MHDLRTTVESGAVLGLITTVIVCIALGTGSYILAKITQTLVLDPIEVMIEKVKDITMNPIQAAQQAENEIVRLEEQEMQLAFKGQVKKAKMETEVL